MNSGSELIPPHALQGYHDPAVMHLRNCEPRGKENAKNISHITSELSRYVRILSTKCCTASIALLGYGNFSQLAVISIVAYNYIKTVYDNN